MKFCFPFLLFLFCSLFQFGQNPDSISIEIEKYIDEIDPAMPVIDLVFEQNISDISICKGPNHTYYLTGTTGDALGVQDGIRVWASSDMKKWNAVNDNGFVWTFINDGEKWQKEISTRNGWKQRGIISPKIYYFFDTFWITYTNSNSNRSGILKSTSGKVYGPWKEVSGEIPLVEGENASLFQDSDSTVYFIYNNGFVHAMNKEMTGFKSAQPRTITDELGNKIGNCCIQLTKVSDRYILSSSKWNSIYDVSKSFYSSSDRAQSIDLRFDGVIASSNSLFGGYKFQPVPVPHSGGGSLFADFEDNLWYALSGKDVAAPVVNNPAFLPLKIDQLGEIKPKNSYVGNDSIQIVYVSSAGNNSKGNSWENAYTSLQRAVDLANDNSQIWISKGKYDAPVEINLRNGLSFYGGFIGNEASLNERNSAKNRVVVNGRNSARHVFSIKSSNNIRIDGLTIQGGNASGESIQNQYGAGIHILGGGETVRIINCNFENNKADLDGGALYCSIGSAPLLLNCIFKNNVSKNNGGAVSVNCNAPNGYHPRFINCIFDNNFAYGDGGAIYFDTNKKKNGLLSVINCLITNNTTLKEGGAITLDRNSNLLMINSTVCFNKGTVQGAAIGSFGKVPAKSRVINSVFYQNYGGILFTIEGEAETVKTIDNAFIPNIWVQFSNCLFEANEVYGLVQRNFDRKTWKNVSELNESIMGRNCFQGDPMFIDPYKGDFHLNNSSKAKSTANKSYYFIYSLDCQLRNPDSFNLGCY